MQGSVFTRAALLELSLTLREPVYRVTVYKSLFVFLSFRLTCFLPDHINAKSSPAVREHVACLNSGYKEYVRLAMTDAVRSFGYD